MKSFLNKETFVKLAQALAKQSKYENELEDAILAIASKNNIMTDFMGLPTGSDVLINAIFDTIRDFSEELFQEFEYWVFECDRNFDNYNKRITYSDGSHPNVHSLEDLYDEIIK